MKHSEYCPCQNSVTVPDKAFTANGVEIVDGLRVFTNNLDRGTIDLTRATWEWYPSEDKHHLWFYVDVDTDYKGNPVEQRYSQSDDRVATRFKGQNA